MGCFQLQCSGAVRRSDWLQRWTHAAAAAVPRPVRALQGGPACEQAAGAAEVLHTGCTALLLLLHRCVTWQRCSSPAPPMCPPAAPAQRLLSCFVPNVATGQGLSWCCPPPKPHRACSSTTTAPMHLPNYNCGLAAIEECSCCCKYCCYAIGGLRCAVELRLMCN